MATGFGGGFGQTFAPALQNSAGLALKDKALQADQAANREKMLQDMHVRSMNALSQLGDEMAKLRGNAVNPALGDARVKKTLANLTPLLANFARGAGIGLDEATNLVLARSQTGATGQETGAVQGAVANAAAPGEAAAITTKAPANAAAAAKTAAATTRANLAPDIVAAEANKAKTVGLATPTGLERELIAAGLKPGTPEFEKAMMAAVTKPQTQILPGMQSPLGKLASDKAALLQMGYKENDPLIKSIDRQIKEASVPSGDKLRTQEMAKSGARTLQDVMKILMPKGKVDTEAVQSMWANLPFTDGRTTNSRFQELASFILRIETGAQANESEIANTAQRYMPKPWDNEQTIKDKLARLQRRFSHMNSILSGSSPLASMTPDQRKLVSDAITAIDAGAPKDKVIEALKARGITQLPGL